MLTVVGNILLLGHIAPFAKPSLRLVASTVGVTGGCLPITNIITIYVLFKVLIVLLLVLLVGKPGCRGGVGCHCGVPLVLLTITLFTKDARLTLRGEILSGCFKGVTFTCRSCKCPCYLTAAVFGAKVDYPESCSRGRVGEVRGARGGLPRARRRGHPGVLFLRLRSFFSPALIGCLGVSRSPVPAFHGLVGRCSSKCCGIPSINTNATGARFRSVAKVDVRCFKPKRCPCGDVLERAAYRDTPCMLGGLNCAARTIRGGRTGFCKEESVFPGLKFSAFASRRCVTERGRGGPGN